MDHTTRAVIALTTVALAIAIALVGLIKVGDLPYYLREWRMDWHRRQYLTAAERAELRRQQRLERHCPDWEFKARFKREREIKLSKFRSDLLIDPHSEVTLADLSARQLVAEYRQAVIWRRTVESWAAQHTTSGCLDGFPIVSQWRTQVEALDAEYDRRTTDPVHRWLSWRERYVLRRAAFEFGDWDAQHLPLPLNPTRPALHPSFGDSEPGLALISIDSIEEF